MAIDWLIICVLFTVLMACVWLARIKKPSEKEHYPFLKRRYLCTKDERNFFRYLMKAIGGDYLILVKVRLIDIVAIEPTIEGRKRRSAYDTVRNKRVDFVLVDRATTEIKVIVDLYDDRANNSTDVQRAIFLDRMFAAAQLPIIRFRLSENYSIADIKHVVRDALGRHRDNKANTRSVSSRGSASSSRQRSDIRSLNHLNGNTPAVLSRDNPSRLTTV